MTKSQKTKTELLLTFNKLLIFPLCITYMIINVITILNYDPNLNLYYKVWNLCKDHDILEHFYFFENIGMELSLSCNNVISVILTLMMIADIIFSIKNGRKQIIKWILYGIIAVIVLFIGFVASPEFYDSV